MFLEFINDEVFNNDNKLINCKSVFSSSYRIYSSRTDLITTFQVSYRKLNYYNY